MKLMPPLINSERSKHPPWMFWECLDSESQLILRSHCKKSWRPPEFHFVAFNVGAMSQHDAGGDYRNQLPEAHVPNSDRYASVK